MLDAVGIRNTSSFNHRQNNQRCCDAVIPGKKNKTACGMCSRGLHQQNNHSVLTSPTPFWINANERASERKRQRRERLLMCCDAGLGVNALIVRRGGDDSPHLAVLWLIQPVKEHQKTKYGHLLCAQSTSWNDVNRKLFKALVVSIQGFSQ